LSASETQHQFCGLLGVALPFGYPSTSRPVPFGYPSTSLRASAQGPRSRTAGRALRDRVVEGFRDLNPTYDTMILAYGRV